MESIGHFLHASDILSSRLVPRGVATCTEKQILERCYASLAFIPALATSLDRMKPLSEHAHLLSRTGIVTPDIDIPNAAGLKGSIMDEQRDSLDQSRATGALQRSHPRRYGEFSATHQGIVDSLQDFASMRNLFSTIAQGSAHGVCLPSRSMYQYHGWPIPRQDMIVWQSKYCRRFEQECGELQSLFPYEEYVCRLLERLFEAVQFSGLRVDDFITEGPGMRLPSEALDHSLTWTDVWRGFHKMRHLSHLQLRLHDESVDHEFGLDGGPVDSPICFGLRNLLEANAPTVRSCRVSAKDDANFPAFEGSVAKRRSSYCSKASRFPG